MKLGFSEFSYGYAFTENLIRRSKTKPTIAPQLPNLRDEAMFGYDIKIDLPGVPLFFQFKLPEYMKYSSTKNSALLQSLGLPLPFFRMPLMQRNISKQHECLMNLEACFPGLVFYASTGNENVTSFNCAYAKTEVHLQSVLFSPTDIGTLFDNKKHIVAYRPNHPVAWRCSEPGEVKVYTFNEVSKMVNRRIRSTELSIANAIKKVGKSVWPYIPEELKDMDPELRQQIEKRLQATPSATPVDDGEHSIAAEFQMLRKLIGVVVGAEFLIAQPSKKE